MAPPDSPTLRRSPWWHYGLILVGAILLMAYLLPNRPGTSRLEPVYLSRLGVMGAVVGVTIFMNLRVLVPQLMHRRRFVLYFIALFSLVALGAHAVFEGNGWVQERMTGNPPRYPSPKDKMLMVFFNQIMVFAGLSSILHYIRTWGRGQALQRQKLEAELTALKAQLNPHFLFNSLNNIYSLALDKSDLAPDYVLKLSELMRYILHDSQAVSVSLGKELEFVRNYLDLERIRMGEPVKMTLKVVGDPEGIEVAPLLLLPFVENAFKHGTDAGPDSTFVNIVVKITDDGGVVIEVVNHKDDTEVLENLPGGGTPGGVGLENLRRRLTLLYPARHELALMDRETKYAVKLEITP